ncbi:hypothetical protein KEM55_006980, partial [Ascosphaera atra]
FKKRHAVVDRARKQSGFGAATERGDKTVQDTLTRMDRAWPLLHKVFSKNDRDGDDESENAQPAAAEGFTQPTQATETMTGDSMSGLAPLQTDESLVETAAAAAVTVAATEEVPPTATAPDSAPDTASEAAPDDAPATLPTQARMTFLEEPAPPVATQPSAAATQPSPAQNNMPQNDAQTTPGAPKRKLPGQTEWEDVIALSDRRIKATKEATIEVARMPNEALTEVARGETQRQEAMMRMFSNMTDKYQETNACMLTCLRACWRRDVESLRENRLGVH